MSHIWVSHVTHMSEPCHTYACVMSAGNDRGRSTHMNEKCHTCFWVMSHTWMSHVTRQWQVKNATGSLWGLLLVLRSVKCVLQCVAEGVAVCCSVFPLSRQVRSVKYIKRDLYIWKEPWTFADIFCTIAGSEVCGKCQKRPILVRKALKRALYTCWHVSHCCRFGGMRKCQKRPVHVERVL